MSSWQVKHSAFAGCEGASVFHFCLLIYSAHYFSNLSMVMVCHEFLQNLVDRHINIGKLQSHTNTQLAKLLTQIRQWVCTTIETSEAWVDNHMIIVMEWFTREMHGRINNFEIQIDERFCEVQIPDLSTVREKVTSLRSMVYALSESHTFIIHPVITTISQTLPTPLPQVINLFNNVDKSPATKKKRA